MKVDCFKDDPPCSDTDSGSLPAHRAIGPAHDRCALAAGRLSMPPLAENWPILAFALGAVAVVVVAMLALRDGHPPYERRGILLTAAEINFLRTLQLAVREDWLIFSKVRLSDIIKVRPRTRKFQSWQSRIQGKPLDFVLCDEETLEI